MISQTKTPRPLYIDQFDQLKLIGYLAILLPLIVLAAASLICGCKIQESISHYYYTIAGDLFVGILCAIGTFMVFYKGYDKNDRIAAMLAGIFAFGVALFPTDMNSDDNCNILKSYPESDARVMVHYIFAALLFCTLAIMCLFLFTRSDKPKALFSRNKKYQNGLYQFFGVLILLSILIIYLGRNNIEFRKYNLTFWFEWVATYSFGIAWLIKGKVFLKN